VTGLHSFKGNLNILITQNIIGTDELFFYLKIEGQKKEAGSVQVLKTKGPNESALVICFKNIRSNDRCDLFPATGSKAALVSCEFISDRRIFRHSPDKLFAAVVASLRAVERGDVHHHIPLVAFDEAVSVSNVKELELAFRHWNLLYTLRTVTCYQ
jgi:hypothetical protein